MGEKTGGKRLAPDENKGKKRGAVIAAAILAALVCAYAALCAYAHRDVFWSGTSVLGVDLSGLTTAQGRDALTSALPNLWAGRTVTLTGGDQRFTLDAAGLMAPEDLDATLDQAACGGYGRNAPFLTAGFRYVQHALNKDPVNIVPALTYTPQGRQQVDALARQVDEALGVPGRETAWRYGKDAIVFIKGYTKVSVDQEELRRGITLALTGMGPTEVPITLVEIPPEEPDLDKLSDEIYTVAAAAYLDKDTGEVVPSVTGLEFSARTAKAALAAAKEGEICSIPLTVTIPSPTTEELEAMLFRDVLGEAATLVTGTSDRHTNVRVAAAFLNDTVIFPDEEFSFNKVCSPYTVDNGYGKATAYVNGLSKDTVAGGICQASSTLYWATLRANLETVERSAHRYEPTYIKGGLDATVYGDYGDDGGLDFRFKNTNGQPIRLEAYVDKKNYLHVLIHGTDLTGIHGEPYAANRIVTKPYDTIYEAKASVPQGTTLKDPERTGYNGVSIETYQKLIDAQGNVVEDKLLYKTRYYVRNEVIFFNPADIWLWNIDPVTGMKLPTPGTTTPATGAPAAEPTPASGGAAAPTAAPTQGGEDPGGHLKPSGAPETAQPAPVPTPVVPVATEAPQPEEPVLPPPSISIPPITIPTPPAYDPDEPMLPPGL